MKRMLIFTFAVATLSAAKVNAQTEKGDWMVGGMASLTTTKNNTSYVFSPNAGHFFARNFVVGANLSFESSKIGSNKVTSFGIGPFTRYYFDLKQNNMKPFVHVGIDFYTDKTKAGSVSNTTHSTGLFAAPGVAYFITPNVALEAAAGYRGAKAEGDKFRGGLGLNIGFQIHLLGNQLKAAGK
jgi:outer membrane protein W